jgi:serine protease Do
MTGTRERTNSIPQRPGGKLILGAIAGLLLLGGLGVRSMAAQRTPAQAPAAVTVAQPAMSAAGHGMHDSYADIVKIVAPAVVTIRTEARAAITNSALPDEDTLRRFFGQGQGRGTQGGQPRMRTERALGSGVIISADGYILTNNHVVDGADVIRIDIPDGRTFDAALVGTDKASDLALLKIKASDLHPVVLGNSDAMQVGDVVLAIGNPLGVGQTVTMGIISAKGRSTGLGDGGYESFLQTDAPINEGNSGGALVNTRGELIGINSQILSPSSGSIGIGFAIPSNMAHNVVDQLRENGRVRRAQLGAVVQPVTSDLAASLGLAQVGGALVSSVATGSAADRAGIERGDVIETFNGTAVTDTNDLRNRVAEAQPGSTATMDIVRNGSKRTVTLKLGELAASETARRNDRNDRNDRNEGNSPVDRSALGVAVEPLTPALAEQIGAPKDAQGLVVRSVDPGSRAADAGIQPGDLIEAANRQPVSTVDQLRSAIRTDSTRPMLLLVNRDGRDLFLTVRPAAS